MSLTQPVTSPWLIGDFHKIGAATAVTGDLLCEDADLSAGLRVLDVACGSGNTAFSAARRGCSVHGLDLYDKLIERANVRAQTEGFEVTFRTGNAEELPYAEAEFDAVISTFGVMFAPNQQRAAQELIRVCKPGGTIALSNWTAESFPGGMFGVGSRFGPPRPPEFRPPIRWGSVAGLLELFPDVAGMRLYDRVLYMRSVDFESWFDTFRNYFGPMKMLFDGMAPERQAEAREALRELAQRYNRATDGTLNIFCSYVNVVIRTRG